MKFLLNTAFLKPIVAVFCLLIGISLTTPVVEAKDDSVSILFILYDQDDFRGPETDRSASYYLSGINKETRELQMIEFPQGMTLNHWEPYSLSELFEQSSEEGVKQYLSEWYDLDHYVSVNLVGLASAVELLDGVALTPTATFNYGGFDFVEGMDTQVTGEGLLAYTRYQGDGHYQRQERQLEALQVIEDNLSTLNYLTNLLNLRNLIVDYVETDLGIWNLIKLFSYYRDHKNTGEWVAYYDYFAGESMEFNSYPYEIMDEEQLINHSLEFNRFLNR